MLGLTIHRASGVDIVAEIIIELRHIGRRGLQGTHTILGLVHTFFRHVGTAPWHKLLRVFLFIPILAERWTLNISRFPNAFSTIWSGKGTWDWWRLGQRRIAEEVCLRFSVYDINRGWPFSNHRSLEIAEELCRKEKPNQAVPYLMKAMEDSNNLDAFVQCAFLCPTLHESVECLETGIKKGLLRVNRISH